MRGEMVICYNCYLSLLVVGWVSPKLTQMVAGAGQDSQGWPAQLLLSVQVGRTFSSLCQCQLSNSFPVRRSLDIYLLPWAAHFVISIGPLPAVQSNQFL